MNEFDLMTRLRQLTPKRTDVLLGMGDDCALLSVPKGHYLVSTTDSFVCGTHFSPDLQPEAIAYKALAVNLSDLAAMGAEPAWISLAVTLPSLDDVWIDKFCHGLTGLLERHRVAVVGGDTTQGPLSITVHACGFVLPGLALTRSGANNEDLIYVSGSLGDAGFGLMVQEGEINLPSQQRKHFLGALHYPTPQVALGQALQGIATACIDVSDGLLADLGHIAVASGFQAEVVLEKLPLSTTLTQSVEQEKAWDLALSSGDDYQLCFCISAEKKDDLKLLTKRLGVSCFEIGRMRQFLKPGDVPVDVVSEMGHCYTVGKTGFQHFDKKESLWKGKS